MKYFLLIYMFFFNAIINSNALQEMWVNAYETGELNYEETRSGMGSSLAYTKAIRRKLPELFKKYNITSVVDIGCGDFNWLREVIPPHVRYVGIDIVPSIIEYNDATYATENISFMQLDAMNGPLPKADLILCREVLPFLSFENASKIIKVIRESGSRYGLFTTFTSTEKNTDLPDGLHFSNYRVNMQRWPFLFPKPLELLSEEYHVSFTPDKCLALWELAYIIPGVTYLDDKDWGGRLGDKLIMYAKAKWVAFRYKMPFFYKPFAYSDQLMMHEIDTHWRKDQSTEYVMSEDPYAVNAEKGVTPSNQMNQKIKLESFVMPFSNKLHIVNYFFMSEDWGGYQSAHNAQNVAEWKGAYDFKEFRDELRKTIAPRYEMNPIQLPEDRLTGGGTCT